MEKLYIFLLVICLSVTSSTADGKKPKVILFLLDGLRADRYGCENLPGLDGIAANGVRADFLEGVYVTFTGPGTFSVASGLYPESHGVIHNIYFKAETQEKYSYSDGMSMPERWDHGAEPIWTTAKLQGLKSGVLRYPGGQTPYKDGVLPDKVIERYDEVDLDVLVDTAIDWLLEDDLDFIAMYTVTIDDFGHYFGTDSNITQEVVRRVDFQIQRLTEKLKKTGLSEHTNLIITSDHGMKNYERGKVLRLYDYVRRIDIEFEVADYGPFFQFLPKEGRLDRVYNSLKDAHPNMHVYKKEEFPERFHYANNPQVLPIIGFMDPGWASYTDIISNLPENFSIPIALQEFPEFPGIPNIRNLTGNFSFEDGDRLIGGQHGYDNKYMDMKPSFYAQGPFFKKGYQLSNDGLHQVDIYPMICEILGIVPAPNNGTREHWIEIMAGDESSSSSSQPSEAMTTPRLSTSKCVIFTPMPWLYLCTMITFLLFNV